MAAKVESSHGTKRLRFYRPWMPFRKGLQAANKKIEDQQAALEDHNKKLQVLDVMACDGYALNLRFLRKRICWRSATARAMPTRSFSSRCRKTWSSLTRNSASAHVASLRNLRRRASASTVRSREGSATRAAIQARSREWRHRSKLSSRKPSAGAKQCSRTRSSKT